MNAIALLPPPAGGELISWSEDIEQARSYIRASRAPSTRRCYAKDWRAFEVWAAARGRPVELPIPAALAVLHLSWMATGGAAVSSIGRRAAALAYAHKQAGIPSPTEAREVREAMAGIRRTLGVAPRSRKDAATAGLLTEMLAGIPRGTLAGKRDRALLALGFASAMRRSELVALDVADITEAPEGIRVMVRRSKTDQVGAGQEIAIPHGRHIRPYALLREWLTAAGITEGALFRQIRRGDHVQAARLSGDAVAAIVKQWAGKAGLDPAKFAGHSLRAGFATEAVDCGADPFAVCTVTRHKNINTLTAYVRRKDAFKQHPGDAFL